MIIKKYLIFACLILASVMSIFITGCASPVKGRGRSLFFPPPPSEPRLQFLTSISSSADVLYVSPFKRFIMGPPKVFPIRKPQGVRMKDGKIYVCDTSFGLVLVADLVGRSFYPMPTVGGGSLIKPIRMDFGEDGNIYVADVSKRQVAVYGSDSVCRWLISGVGRSMKPTDVLVHEGMVYIADLSKPAVQVYDKKTHMLIAEIPNEKSQKLEKESLYQPLSLAMYEDGSGLLVSDIGGFRIQHYDLNGNYVKTIGGHGDLPGQLARPKGIALDREGRLYVADGSLEVVQIFNKDGTLLSYFGGKGSPATLVLPADVEINYDGVEFFREYIDPDFDVEYLVLVTSQFGPRKVSVFGYGRMKNQ